MIKIKLYVNIKLHTQGHEKVHNFVRPIILFCPIHNILYLL